MWFYCVASLFSWFVCWYSSGALEVLEELATIEELKEISKFKGKRPVNLENGERALCLIILKFILDRGSSRVKSL